jgi:DNA-binding transcriptional MerR regulator
MLGHQVLIVRRTRQYGRSRYAELGARTRRFDRAFTRYRVTLLRVTHDDARVTSMSGHRLQVVEGETVDKWAGRKPESLNALTIEQVAQETGMTTRNIRAHQSRGLLPPPEVRASTGYYGPEHVARLRLIREMQADGYNLNAIKRLLSGAPGAAEQVLGFKRAMTTPFETERPELLTEAELASRFGPDVSAKTLEKAEKLGLLVPLGDGRYEAPMPSLLAAADELIGRGVSLPAALSVVERLKRHCEGVSQDFVELVLDAVWKPFEEAGYPESRWSDVVESVERLRPLASQALVAVFQQTMTREVEGAFGKLLERGAKRRG